MANSKRAIAKKNLRAAEAFLLLAECLTEVTLRKTVIAQAEVAMSSSGKRAGLRR